MIHHPLAETLAARAGAAAVSRDGEKPTRVAASAAVAARSRDVSRARDAARAARSARPRPGAPSRARAAFRRSPAGARWRSSLKNPKKPTRREIAFVGGSGWRAATARVRRARAERSPRNARHDRDDARLGSYLLVGLAVLRRPRQLRRAKAEVKETLALGVEEEVGLAVDLGQPHAVTGVDLQAGEPTHLRLKDHLALTCEVVDARVGEGERGDETAFTWDVRSGENRTHTRVF